MLFKRNHTLKYEIVTTTGSTQNSNGDWVPGTSVTTIVELACRSEPNGQGKTVRSQDGQDIVFNRVVYLDFDAPDIPFGTKIELFNNGVSLSKDTVKLFERDQKKCRIWV